MKRVGLPLTQGSMRLRRYISCVAPPLGSGLGRHRWTCAPLDLRTLRLRWTCWNRWIGGLRWACAAQGLFDLCTWWGWAPALDSPNLGASAGLGGLAGDIGG